MMSAAMHPGRIRWEQNLSHWRQLFSHAWRSQPLRRPSPSTAEFCTSIIARRRRASRSTRRRRSRSTCRSMAVFNNLVVYDQHKPQNSMDTIVPELADQLGLEQGRHAADLQAAPGREMARRQAVHRQGREMHLRPAAGQGAGQVPQESAQGLVRQRRRTSPSTATTR